MVAGERVTSGSVYRGRIGARERVTSGSVYRGRIGAVETVTKGSVYRLVEILTGGNGLMA